MTLYLFLLNTSRLMQKKLLAILILCGIAFLNALYLTYESFYPSANGSFCDVGNTFSCSKVLQSPHALIFGVPFPAIAAVVYPLLFSIGLLGYFGKIKKPFSILLPLSIGGMCFNGFFIYKEFFFIHNFCLLCLMCSAIITTIAIISGFGLKDQK